MKLVMKLVTSLGFAHAEGRINEVKGGFGRRLRRPFLYQVEVHQNPATRCTYIVSAIFGS